MSEIDTILEENTKFIDEFNKAKEEMQKKLSVSLESMFKAYLEKQPKVKEFVWTQYTPYFNDGEPCVFNRHDIYVIYNEIKKVEESALDDEYGPSSEDEEDEDEGYEYYDYPSIWSSSDEFYSSDRKALKENAGMTDQEIAELQSFMQTLNKIPEDVYESMFGDHVEVRATRKGFVVDEYSHD